MTASSDVAAVTLLAELTQRGIELRVDGNDLRFRPKNTADELVRRIRLNKPALLRILGRAGDIPPEREAEIDARVNGFFDNCALTPDGRGVYDPRRISRGELRRILQIRACMAPNQALYWAR